MWQKFSGGIVSCFVLVGLLWSCSTKKDAFLNRNWHALNTRYNVVYNGNLAFETGRENLRETFKDNYWEILPVERLAVSEKIKLHSEANTPEFIQAEEKATKAIQKHSMELDNEERNPQTDEAFLLLGKARYFDERYIPALEAFNYILRKYPESNRLNQAAIWREKTNIRLGYDELALNNLKRLLRFEKLTEQEYADARSVMGQAYLNLNIPDTALFQLKTAAAYTRVKEERARYMYITGQLYNLLGQTDSANLVFRKLTAMNRSIPRTYLVNAQLELYYNMPQSVDNQEYVLDYLTELQENRENRPFLDKIYRALAVFHSATGSDSLAVRYFTWSTQASERDPVISAMNYEDLANYYFDGNDYPRAGAYYDSVLVQLEEHSRKFRLIQKRRANLDQVIVLERSAQETDSILKIVAMSPVSRKIYFQNYVDSLRTIDLAAQAEDQNQAAKKLKQKPTRYGRETTGTFYFYNSISLEQGKANFTAQWGNRALEDNWRLQRNVSTGMDPAIAQNESAIASNAIPEKLVERYNPEAYLSKVPQQQDVIDSLHRERNRANYELGIIYKEKFKAPFLAVEKLNNILNWSPEEGMEMSARYNLFRIYEESRSDLAEQMKQFILEKHPDSRFAAIIKNSNQIALADASGPESEYQKLYEVFESQDFNAVLSGVSQAIQKFPGDPLIPKFELLKAQAIAKVEGFNSFKSALSLIALDYPNTEAGQKAKNILEFQLPKMESDAFEDPQTHKGAGNWKVVFPFAIQDQDQARALRELLIKSMKDLGYPYTVSEDRYTAFESFIVVHGFPSEAYAQGYTELLRNNADYKVSSESFVIFTSHYKTIQVHKNLEAFKSQKFPQISANQ
ncbi:MAG: hypothetical protein RLZZ241_1683 [Bacteroidota bacterium]|jgi:tetratricopeptide (TPR) repeat protein